MPVQRTEVGIHTERGTHEVVIFLAPDASPEDLLEQEAAFFPAEEDGVVHLYARSAVVSVVVDDTDDEPLSELGIPYEKRGVVVCLKTGETIHGNIRFIGRTRTLDLLNQPARSFAVRSEGKLHHVAKAHVEHIEEIR